MKKELVDVAQYIQLDVYRSFLESSAGSGAITYDTLVNSLLSNNLMEDIGEEFKLNELGKLLFGSSLFTDIYRDFKVKVVTPSNSVEVYNFTGTIYQTFENMFGILNTHIPEFQDRSHPSTLVKRGLYPDETKAMLLFILAAKNYSISEPLILTVNQSRVFFNTQAITSNDLTILTRLNKFIDIFIKGNKIQENDKQIVLDYLILYIKKIQNGNNVSWLYRGVEAPVDRRKKESMLSQIVEYMSRRENVTRKQVQEFFDLPERTTLYYLNKLIRQNKILKTTASKHDPNVSYSVNPDYLNWKQERNDKPQIFVSNEEPKDAKDGDLWFQVKD